MISRASAGLTIVMSKAAAGLSCVYLVSLSASIWSALHFLWRTVGFYGAGLASQTTPCRFSESGSGADDDAVLFIFVLYVVPMVIRAVRISRPALIFEVAIFAAVAVFYAFAVRATTCADFYDTLVMHRSVSLWIAHTSALIALVALCILTVQPKSI